MTALVFSVVYIDIVCIYSSNDEYYIRCLIHRSKLVENYSKPSIANFGRSLFGGYCPTYVPDFVLHGMPSDEKLRQSLMSELGHAVQVRKVQIKVK